jgi:8-amino-7-oxononanoate synthase
VSFEAEVAKRIASLKAADLHRVARKIEGPQGPRLRVDGRDVLCLCANNYLGFAGDPRMLQAARDAVADEGFGSGASRLISGSMSAHRDAEAELAAYVRKPDAALFSTGYAANVGTVQALLTREHFVFSDALNHASLIDGARLSRARIVVYDHADPDDLARKLKEHAPAPGRALIASESLFSMDGDIAPLAQLAQLARDYQAGFLVDEAHAIGVFGPEGRGLCAREGIEPDLLVGTLGKAFGVQGAFVAGSAAAVDLLRNRSRSYVFSTAPAAPVARLSIAALRMVREADDRRERLRRHTQRLRAALAELGYRVLDGESAIIPVIVGDPEPTMAMSAALLEEGVFAHGIRPPTVPEGTGRLRVVPMATHTDDDISAAIEAFKKVRR